jgi:hypothetical protein
MLQLYVQLVDSLRVRRHATPAGKDVTQVTLCWRERGNGIRPHVAGCDPGDTASVAATRVVFIPPLGLSP